MALRPRFSILSLLLFTALVCGSITHWQLRQEHAAVQLENQKLRDDHGYLVIHDPEKAYIREGHSYDCLTSTYRVYLPDGKRYYLYRVIGTIAEPYHATREAQAVEQVSAGFFDAAVSLRVEASEWKLAIRIADTSRGETLPDELSKRISNRIGPRLPSRWATTIPHDQREFDPSEPILLSSRTWSNDDGTTVGVAVYFDVERPDKRLKRLTSMKPPSRQK